MYVNMQIQDKETKILFLRFFETYFSALELSLSLGTLLDMAILVSALVFAGLQVSLSTSHLQVEVDRLAQTCSDLSPKRDGRRVSCLSWLGGRGWPGPRS